MPGFTTDRGCAARRASPSGSRLSDGIKEAYRPLSYSTGRDFGRLPQVLRLGRETTMSFEIRIDQCGAMSEAVALEAVAMFAKGWVRGSIATASQIDFTVERMGQQSLRVLGSISDRSNEEGKKTSDMRAIVAIYSVMAGFWSSNCSVHYIGPRSEFMPGQGKPLTKDTEPTAVQKPFEGLLPKSLRTKPVPFKTLNAIHDLIAQHPSIETLLQSNDILGYAPSLEPKPTHVWIRHKSGLLIDFDLTAPERCHRIGGVKYTAEPVLKNCCQIDVTPKRVATWGEAWVRYDASTKGPASHLHIFQDEIGILANGLVRFSIEDADTLKRLAKISFGQTASTHLSAAEMVKFGQHYLKQKKWIHAKNCIEQAKLLGATDYPKIPKTLRKPRIPVPETVTHSLIELNQVLSEHGIAIVAKVQEEHELEYRMTSDYGRYPYTIPGVKYESLVQVEQLEQAGFTVNILSTLFNRAASKELEDTKGLFWFEVEGYKIWGCHATSWYFVKGLPNQVFGQADI